VSLRRLYAVGFVLLLAGYLALVVALDMALGDSAVMLVVGVAVIACVLFVGDVERNWERMQADKAGRSGGDPSYEDRLSRPLREMASLTQLKSFFRRQR
jgi:hypothetical protein